jgi:hypothetical protein
MKHVSQFPTRSGITRDQFVRRYATILAFDVKIERDAQELADSLGVKIFQADIIYHLFDKFTAYREELKQRKRDENKHIAVFPCKLKILPQVSDRCDMPSPPWEVKGRGVSERIHASLPLPPPPPPPARLSQRWIFPVSVRIQLEGPDRDRCDGRGWNRQGRNADLRPEQRRE